MCDLRAVLYVCVGEGVLRPVPVLLGPVPDRGRGRGRQVGALLRPAVAAAEVLLQLLLHQQVLLFHEAVLQVLCLQLALLDLDQVRLVQELRDELLHALDDLVDFGRGAHGRLLLVVAKAVDVDDIVELGHALQQELVFQVLFLQLKLD